MSEYLRLKWGTLKAWDLGDNEAAIAAGNRYDEAGSHCMSAAMLYDNPEQKQAICDMIDAINGSITNDWTGEVMSKDEAKRYVMEYGK